MTALTNRGGRRRRGWMLAVALVAALGGGAARADWTVESSIALDNPMMKGQTQKTTMRVKDKNVRIDVAQGASSVSMLYFGETGEQVTLMHMMKMAQKRSASQVKEAAEQGEKFLAKNPAIVPKEAPKAKATGKTEKVNGYDAAEYVADAPDRKQTFWVAKDVPHATELRDAMVGAMKAGNGQSVVDPESLPGFPVRSIIEVAAHEMKLPGGQNVNVPAMKMVSDVTSIKEEKLDASLFEIPKEYKMMDVPTLPQR